MNHRTATLATILTCSLAHSVSAASVAGIWLFDDAGNTAAATVGNPLVFEGTAPVYSSTLSDDSAVSLTGAITTAAALATNRVFVDHGIAPNGGGAFVNQYSIVLDLFSPAASRDAWRTIYQTSTSNDNDGEYFIRNNNSELGSADLTYAPAISNSDWTRLVITADLSLSENDVLTYLDGSLHFTHAPDQGLDGRYSLDPSVYFFTDNDGDNAPLNIGALAIYDGVLTATEISALGSAGSPIPVPEPSTGIFLALATFAMGFSRRRPKTL